MTLGALAVVVAAGGIGYAQIPDPGAVIHGCYARSGGTLRVIDNSVAICKSTETRSTGTRPARPAPPARKDHRCRKDQPVPRDRWA
jgi:hypothetical protein